MAGERQRQARHAEKVGIYLVGYGREGEKRGEEKRERQRESGRTGKQEGEEGRDRSCLFGRETERKGLRLKAEERSTCLSGGWRREWEGLVSDTLTRPHPWLLSFYNLHEKYIHYSQE